MGFSSPPVKPSQLQPFPPLPRLLRPTLIPALHLTQLAAAIASNAASASGGTPTITFCGDSTSTKNANNAVAQSENLFGQFMRRIREDYPGVSIRFNDRGIGGSTWNDLKGIPNFAGGITPPSWYTVPSQPWLQTYVKPNAGIGNPGPDVLVIPMGTNDSYFIALSNIRTVLDIIANTSTFPITPDIIFVTPHGRTPNNGDLSQNGYQMASGLMRSIGIAGPTSTGSTLFTKRIGVIDLGRMDAMSRLGFDPCVQYLTRKMTAQSGITAFPFAFAQCDGDFDLQLTFPAQASTLFGSSNAITISAGPSTAGGSELCRVRFSLNPTNIIAQYLYGPYQSTVSANAPIGTGNVTFRVSCKQSHLIVEANGVILLDQLVARPGGYFQPTLAMTVPPTGASMTVDAYSAGSCIATQKTLTDAQMWGGQIIGGNGSPIDGNAINHESSYGAALTIAAALEAVRFV
ncbi:hypothetical protein [Methylobacterium sp. V23]|uniref:hypothetical protein n=1 Tax=Methylobacterium sp. V23 TaxID=2044878 RepID=UPI000CDA1200|nr:hypothetical protein [Methylobacterium sp. V23]POR42564.1 hypothetical protein CRT23_12300 [Methylobacterium sp. V23]